jgi:uncharacterized membrane protein
VRKLIIAVALATLIAAPASAAARTADQVTCQSWQNDNCYWQGYPLWQWYVGA